MEEPEYKEAYRDLNPLPCIFQKALLSRRVGCEKSQGLNLAEREAMACSTNAAQQQCARLLEVLYLNAQFALKLNLHHNAPLPHAKAMKLQCGGLCGLHALLSSQYLENNVTFEQVDNVYGLIQEAKERYGSLDDLPFPEIMKFITHYQVRKKTR